MLKAFLGLLVSVVVLLSSACVPPARAASANIMMTHIQAGGSGAATQEFVAIYNNGSDAVNITNWCLTNKTNIVFACFSADTGQARFLPAHSHAVAASASLATALPLLHFATVYSPLSQSSGSIIGGSDTVSLVDATGTLIDQHAWTVSLAGGTQLIRRVQVVTPVTTSVTYIDTDMAADWSVVSPSVAPKDETTLQTVIVDVCANIDGAQATVPDGMKVDIDGICQARVVIQLEIREIFPNAIGSDEGNEFIELFNPNDAAVDLNEYMLWVGPELTASYDFPRGSTIAAHSSLAFSNAQIPFSLLNSSSRVRLTTVEGIIVSDPPAYLNPKDGASWALIGETWQYTMLPTPGADNATMVVEAAIEELTIPTPCAVNQYRNPDTGRCRLIASAGPALTPCKDGQYRSEETNRCRNIAADANVLTPCDAGEERNVETGRCRKIVIAVAAAACKEGQERNPDTNRCRTVTKMPAAGYGVLGAKTENTGSWYAFAAIGGVVLLAVGYAIWEWHDEIGKFFTKWLDRLRLLVRLRK